MNLPNRLAVAAELALDRLEALSPAVATAVLLLGLLLEGMWLSLMTG